MLFNAPKNLTQTKTLVWSNLIEGSKAFEKKLMTDENIINLHFMMIKLK